AHCALYPYGCYSLRRIVALAAHHAPTTDRRVRLGLLLRRNAKSHTRLLPYSDCECFLHECVPDTEITIKHILPLDQTLPLHSRGHAPSKGQRETTGAVSPTPAEQFYALAA